jgi:hypothetical protein
MNENNKLDNKIIFLIIKGIFKIILKAIRKTNAVYAESILKNKET